MNTLTKKQRQYLSDLSLLFVAAVWGGGFVAVKDALNSITPMMLMSMRFTMATIFVYAFLHRRIGKVSKEDFKKGFVVGFILFLAFASQTFGLQFTTASKQGFLTATYVVMVPLIYWMLYKKMPGRRAFIGSFFTIAGIALISFEDIANFSLNLGDGLTLLCALFFAAHIISIEYFAKDMNVFKLAFVQIAVAAVLFTVTAFVTEPIPSEVTTRTWGALLYMSMFSTFLCFTVQTVAQKYTTSSHASIIMSLEAVFAAAFGILLLNEHLTPLMIVGCALIFAAILIVELGANSNKEIDHIQEEPSVL
ncbi:drug/metabolite transporter (DMT)-like permease [Acetoanaerobium pronyense]|uniref:Drug/metabolite transporter (DMT)-like permease n=1 Tax=Acetoanaerobium pronyense TaxID=1482736 RepID=A0ABS4KMF4_9FIRM|nr:DMT family transporter [Acetoanaerobium pronyense]MBP2028958.1 drug/metabolite transporter (DMT)-like permease [Acetoanaerobium pronyense]